MHNSLSKYQVFDLNQQTVRDLAWSLWGPTLLEHCIPYTEDNQFPVDIAWLKALDKNSQILTAYLATKNTRLLGTYFEALWQFYFSHHPRFKYCINNLQVFGSSVEGKDTKQTLGEFDVLVQDDSQKCYHIELACKFYLEIPNNGRQSLWLGPNCHDRLDIKYDKTHNKQLPLLFSEQGAAATIKALQDINKQGWDINTFQQVAIWRGHLFPQKSWVRQQDLTTKLTTLAITEQQGWIIANKTYWLSPIVLLKDEVQVLSNAQLIKQADQYLQEKNSPFMLILLKFDDLRQRWLQDKQLFITPNTWPYGALSDSAEMPLRPCNPPV